MSPVFGAQFSRYYFGQTQAIINYVIRGGTTNSESVIFGCGQFPMFRGGSGKVAKLSTMVNLS